MSTYYARAPLTWGYFQAASTQYGRVGPNSSEFMDKIMDNSGGRHQGVTDRAEGRLPETASSSLPRSLQSGRTRNGQSLRNVRLVGFALRRRPALAYRPERRFGVCWEPAGLQGEVSLCVAVYRKSAAFGAHVLCFRNGVGH